MGMLFSRLLLYTRNILNLFITTREEIYMDATHRKKDYVKHKNIDYVTHKTLELSSTEGKHLPL